MKVAILTVLAAVLVAMAVPATAGAGCPTRMDRLDDFARCMVPMRGTIGTATVYTNPNYDSDHRALMAAMNSGPVIPAQVMPGPSYPSVYPYGSAFSSFAWGMTSAAAYVHSGNPYFWFSLNPYGRIY